MHRRLTRSVLPWLLVGLWIAACGNDTKAPGNQPPVLTGLTAQSTDVTSGASVALAIEATDPEGDALTYSWTQNPPSPAGTFSDRNAAHSTWKAPEVTEDTAFLLGITVSDGKGGMSHQSAQVTVHPTPVVDRAPVLAAGSPKASPTSVVGATPIQLTASATDADGDALTYSWTQVPALPAGTFSDASAANPTWTPPVVSAHQRFTLTVTVSDPLDASAQGSVDVDVDPPVPQNKPPALTAGPSASAATINSQQSVSLSVSASDPDSDPLSYSWVQTAPASLAGAFNSSTAATPTWTAPKVTADTAFQFRVTVSDGKGGSVSGTVSVNVLAPVNRPPTLAQAPQASPTSVTGSAPVQLSVSASDPDGDTLTYAWTQTPASPAGTFNSTSVANPTWTSPVVASAQRFTLTVTVSDGQGGTVQDTVNVDVAPPVPTNNPPTLTGPVATPSTLNAQQSTSLSLTASDPDNDPISYAWTQEPATPAGTFSSTSVANPTWTAPRTSADTVFQLRVTVSDGKGGTDTNTAPVTVHAFVNTSPVLTAGPSASATTINEQQTLNLSVSASDADGDPLTYKWVQTAPTNLMGTFGNSNVANTTWKAPDVTADGTYTLQVTVTDGQGGSVQGTLNITVKKVNQPPTVAATITGPNSLLAGDTGSFSITASDPDGDPLTYSWTQTDLNTQGSWVGSQTASSAQWFSPQMGTQTSFTLSVSVTDGQSTPVVRTITVPVSVPHYAADIQSIWNSVPCTGCHGASGGLNLGATVSYGNLVNASTVNAACSTLRRVTPGDPDNSTLVQKISGTACGNRMPTNKPNYFVQNPGLIIRIRSWILAGANND
ncbi:MAG: PKD domain-containing protein [Hyalangium sp.]|uniref:PKD domain-containing protein n=1 Tax=Hyalangium sp. TaxID=2028555 RepID=UPI00389A97F1